MKPGKKNTKSSSDGNGASPGEEHFSTAMEEQFKKVFGKDIFEDEFHEKRNPRRNPPRRAARRGSNFGEQSGYKDDAEESSPSTSRSRKRAVHQPVLDKEQTMAKETSTNETSGRTAAEEKVFNDGMAFAEARAKAEKEALEANMAAMRREFEEKMRQQRDEFEQKLNREREAYATNAGEKAKEAAEGVWTKTKAFATKHKAPLSLMAGVALGVGAPMAYAAYKDRNNDRNIRIGDTNVTWAPAGGDQGAANQGDMGNRGDQGGAGAGAGGRGRGR